MENPFITEIAKHLAELTPLDSAEAKGLLSTPPNAEKGDYAFPCFNIARAEKKNPAAVAAELAGKFPAGGLIESARAEGPYLNFFVRRDAFLKWLLAEAIERAGAFGQSEEGAGKTVVIEYSSPNIAKHLGIHHVRTTMIGHALYNIHRALGYNVAGINFLGDWGTQFGILIAAYKRWGGEATFKGDAVANLNALYVRFNEAAKEDESLRDEGRAWFKRLEDGDPEAVELWRKFRHVSLAAFEEVYRTLRVTFDEISGESLYDKLMPDTIARLEKMGLAVMDQGALIVDLKAEKMPPVMLRKSDGATLYDTRDIAAAEDRWNRYHFARMIYVVGGDQKLHFRQIFKVLEKMGYSWAKDCVHVDFGIIRMKSENGVAEKMSTRQGRVVMLKDVLNEAVSRALEAIEQKNPDLRSKEQIARAVGIGAVIFNDLKRQRIKDVDFDWQAILNFEGETGPYVQYAHVRLCSILRKYGLPVTSDVDFTRLSEPEEFMLARTLAEFNAVLRRAADVCEPSVLSQYLLDLCGQFSTYYHRHKVISEDTGLTAARILLVEAIRQTIANGLAILGLEAPEEM